MDAGDLREELSAAQYYAAAARARRLQGEATTPRLKEYLRDLIARGWGSGRLPSSSDPMRPEAFACFPGAGSSSEPSPGLAATGGWQKTSSRPIRASLDGPTAPPSCEP